MFTKKRSRDELLQKAYNLVAKLHETCIFNLERLEEKICHIYQQVRSCLNSEQNENNAKICSPWMAHISQKLLEV